MSKRNKRKESFSSSDDSNSDQDFSDNEKPKRSKKKKTIVSDDEVSSLATNLDTNSKKRRRSVKEDPFERQLRLAMEMSLKEVPEKSMIEIELKEKPHDSNKNEITIDSESPERKISESPEDDLPELSILAARKSIETNSESITKEPEAPTTDCINLIAPDKDAKVAHKKSTKKEAKKPRKSNFKSESESSFEEDKDDEDDDEDFDMKRSKKKATPAKKKITPAKKKTTPAKKKELASAEKKANNATNHIDEPTKETLTPRRNKKVNEDANLENKKKSAEKKIPNKTQDIDELNIDQENTDPKVNLTNVQWLILRENKAGIKKSLVMTESILTENISSKIATPETVVPKAAIHGLLPKHVSKLPPKQDSGMSANPFKNEEKPAVSSGFKSVAIPARLADASSSNSPLGRIEIKNNSPCVRVGLSRNSKIPSLHKNVKPF